MTKAEIQQKSVRRRRDMTKTKESILEAARGLFRNHGYDHVGLREIAAEAGCDKALVHRYFGSKEEIFRAVLATLRVAQPENGDNQHIARSIVQQALHPDGQGYPIDDVLITMRSISSPEVTDILRERVSNHVIGPLAHVLTGPDAGLRARLAMAVVGGMLMSRVLFPPSPGGEDAAQERRFEQLLVAALQSDASADDCKA
ncbi:TetR/AcrR family transcriptional regulator [Novosphingobium sp.]|uniref:TetR/AcrR family transcriptional regulator n=1 Tax=Novosphingobium sp. TaxID=1874826 RepID=UPI002FE16718